MINIKHFCIIDIGNDSQTNRAHRCYVILVTLATQHKYSLLMQLRREVAETPENLRIKIDSFVETFATVEARDIEYDELVGPATLRAHIQSAA